MAQQLLNLVFMMISLRSDYNSRSFLLHHRRFRSRKLIGPYPRYTLIANFGATTRLLRRFWLSLRRLKTTPEIPSFVKLGHYHAVE
jgi:hypothetical protein